jgi:UDP-glucose 4-epimerase
MIERLLDRGDDVRVLDNFATGHRSNLEPFASDVEIIEGDIQSYERGSTAVRACDVVVHLAALPSVPRSVQDPLTSNASNVIGTLNVLLASRDAGVQRVVYASSSSVYGANLQLPKHEEMTPLPISPYAVAKLAGEGYCRSFGEVYGLETVAVRYFNVFGPRQDPRSQYAAVVPNFTSALLKGLRPVIFGDGEQSRDFTYVQNVIDANVLAMTVDGIGGRVYNAACGTAVTVNQLFDELRTIVGSEIEPIYRSNRPGDIRHSLASIDRARAELSFEPSVDLREGLSLTTDHIRDELARHASVSLT